MSATEPRRRAVVPDPATCPHRQWTDDTTWGAATEGYQIVSCQDCGKQVCVPSLATQAERREALEE